MTRKCSHCGLNGHNSRTCPNRDRGGVKLFGVRLTDGPIRKSASLGNLLMINNNPPSPTPSPAASVVADPAGYLSDGLLHPSTSSNSRERKKDSVKKRNGHVVRVFAALSEEKFRRLEGDEGYYCWQAYFEFKDLKKQAMTEAEAGSEASKEHLERPVRRSRGMKDLVEMVH